MLRTTELLIASLILSAILVSIFGYMLYTMNSISVPTVKPEVQASLIVNCTTDRVQFGGFYQTYISSINTYLDFGIKNHYGSDILVDKIYPVGVNISSYGTFLSISVPPHSFVDRVVYVNWLNISGLATHVYPGDKVALEYGTLKKKDSGKIAEFIDSPATGSPPDDYTSPFLGDARYDLQVSGTKISAEIKDPGYAIRTILSDYGYSSLLVLTEFKPLEYFYEDYDIPYYIDIYKTGNARTGFYMYANGQLGVFGGSGTIGGIPNDVNYIGFWVANGQAELYLGDDTSPSATGSAHDIAGSNIVYGVAREKKAESSLKLMLVFWNHYDRIFNIPGQWKGHETDYVYFVADPNTGQSYMKMWGPYKTTGSFDNPDSWGTPITDPDNCKCGDSDWPPYIWIQQVNPPGPDPCDPSGVCHGKEILDLQFGWDDTQGCCIEEKFRVTIFEDGWARVEHISTAGRPYDEVFIAPVNDYAPGSDNDGDGYPDNWYHIWSLTNQVGGVVWKDVSQYIHWEKHPVSSDVYYQGIFKGRTVTITGLYPGDRVMLATPNKVYTISAESTTVTVDLLSTFGPKELIEALKHGGVILIVQPSAEHILSLLPSRALVHVEGKTINDWLDVPLLIKPECTLEAGFTSSGTISITRAGEVYKVYAKIPGFSNLLYLGTYPKVKIYHLRNYEVSIAYQDGTNVTIRPGQLIEFAGSKVMFYNDIAILLINDKVVIFNGIQTLRDDKPFTSILIKGVMDVDMSLAK